MTHYRSNVRDMLFDLFELLDRQSAYGNQPFTEIDQDAATAVLEEAERYARTKLAETFGDGGRNQLSFDPDTHTIALPKEYREAAVDYLRSGWLELEFPPANLNELVPPSLCWCVNELMLGANPAIPQGVNVVPQVVRLLLSAGTPEQRRLAELIREKHWMVTMMLTEPDAGSDVGSARTRALPQPDGSWHLDGVKRFITYGDHDLSDNIVHAVLARPVGVEGVGGPGTKGLSLFVVPKYHVDLETGELGARNGVHVTGVEHKMGLHGSPTCEVTFGQHEPAIGWLLGERHAGIAQMFEIIKHIRMLVGVKSLAALSTGYLNARDFAQTRVQGPPLVRRDAGSGSVPIIEHPDLRRSLLTQKAYVEGMRALVLYAGAQQDRIVAAGGEEDVADRRHQLLLPVIKGFCSEMACQLLGQEAMQTFGGSGFLKDYPVEQYLRDTKVDTLYEGTTAIQGLDLLSRKIVRDRGETLDALLNEIRETATTPGPGYEIESRLLLEATDAFAQFARLLVDRWSAGGQEKETAAQDSTRLLLRLGDLLCGWLLLRSGHIADAALAGPAPLTETERDFYTGKAATGRWFARRVLPGLTSDLASARLAWTGLGSVPPTAF